MLNNSIPSTQHLDVLLKLPEIDWTFKEYPSRASMAVFRKTTQRLNRHMQKAGYTDQFNQRLMEILKATDATGQLLGEIRTNRDIRVVIHLWRERDAFLDRFPVSKAILARFARIRTKLSMLALFHLTQLFFERFDTCGDSQALAAYLCRSLDTYPSFSMEDMEHLRIHAHMVLSLQGPVNVVRHSRKQGIELKQQLREFGLPEGQKGIYIDRCCLYRYIETLEQMEMGETSAIFEELSRDHIAMIPYHEQCLGHQVLRTMIEKGMAVGALATSWINVILSIAGDPRTEGSHAYKQWWAQLPAEYSKAMLAWLAASDIEVFLKVIGHYAETHYGHESQRVFPARAHFLQGLYKHGFITASRLFLGEGEISYLNDCLGEDMLPEMAVLAATETSVICLKVGDMYMLEGSHSFRLRLYEALPVASRILDQQVRKFTLDDMGKYLARSYKAEFGKKPLSVIHTPHKCRWQHEVLKKFLSRGIRINPAWVMAKEDYKQYQKNYGLWAGHSHGNAVQTGG